MKTKSLKRLPSMLALMAAWGSAKGFTQTNASTSEDEIESGIASLMQTQWTAWIKAHWLDIIIVVAIIIVIGVVFYLRSRKRPGDDLYISHQEPIENSKFEQVLAEIQGLTLRVQTGENKGYFRKIEQVTRAYMERIGVVGAREMSYDALATFLSSAALPPKHASAISSIFERCRIGAENEGLKNEFSPSDLLRDLHVLIKASEDMHPIKPSRVQSTSALASASASASVSMTSTTTYSAPASSTASSQAATPATSSTPSGVVSSAPTATLGSATAPSQPASSAGSDWASSVLGTPLAAQQSRSTTAETLSFRQETPKAAESSQSAVSSHSIPGATASTQETHPTYSSESFSQTETIRMESDYTQQQAAPSEYPYERKPERPSQQNYTSTQQDDY